MHVYIYSLHVLCVIPFAKYFIHFIEYLLQLIIILQTIYRHDFTFRKHTYLICGKFLLLS